MNRTDERDEMSTTRNDCQDRMLERDQAEAAGWSEARIDGELPVTFTDEEWSVMMRDPSFGYVCCAGHTLTLSERTYGLDCSACEADAYDHEGDVEVVHHANSMGRCGSGGRELRERAIGITPDGSSWKLAEVTCPECRAFETHCTACGVALELDDEGEVTGGEAHDFTDEGGRRCTQTEVPF